MPCRRVAADVVPGGSTPPHPPSARAAVLAGKARRPQGPAAEVPAHSACPRGPQPDPGPAEKPRRTYLMKKEAAADGPVEPPAGTPGAGLTNAVVQTPLRPHVFDTPSEPKVGAPSRTVSATATAATAASAWWEGGSPREGHTRAGEAELRAPEPQHAPRGPALTGPASPAGPTEQTWTHVPTQGPDFLASPTSSSRNVVSTSVVKTEGQGSPHSSPRVIHLGAPRGTSQEETTINIRHKH